jgi:hypothetical protein
MHIDDFIERVRAEPTQTHVIDVRPVTPEILAQTRNLAEIRKLTSTLTPTRVELRKGHILGPPARDYEISRWERLHPSARLPPSARDLLRRINGIHLWADLSTGRSYVGIAPLAEWECASVTNVGGAAPYCDRLSERCVVVSYHANGNEGVALDCDTGKFLSFDETGTVAPIGGVDELLEYAWNRMRIEWKGAAHA